MNSYSKPRPGENQTTLLLKSYAKINISLDVVGKRTDGYHMVETVMQSVSLVDEIQICWEEKSKPTNDGIEIVVTTNKPYIPTDERNLAYKAALKMIENSKIKIPAGILKISIKKRIPVAAGLGGGSGNCAAVMIGLNRLWKIGLSTKDLCILGEDLGADVPFCILTQNTRHHCALGTETGATLQIIKRGLQQYVVLSKPAFGVSTKEVFGGVDQLTIERRPDTKALVHGLKEQDEKEIFDNMINVLELYTLAHYPQVQKLKEKMEETQGVQRVLMSGSGPTVFGCYPSLTTARAARDMLRKEGYESYWAKML